jgi:hypothetical protein
MWVLYVPTQTCLFLLHEQYQSGSHAYLINVILNWNMKLVTYNDALLQEHCIISDGRTTVEYKPLSYKPHNFINHNT